MYHVRRCQALRMMDRAQRHARIVNYLTDPPTESYAIDKVSFYFLRRRPGNPHFADPGYQQALSARRWHVPNIEQDSGNNLTDE